VVLLRKAYAMYTYRLGILQGTSATWRIVKSGALISLGSYDNAPYRSNSCVYAFQALGADLAHVPSCCYRSALSQQVPYCDAAAN
jgi:hypothetical protein